jgi:preprotein translocase subunit SecE
LNPAPTRRISRRVSAEGMTMARTNPLQFVQQVRSEVSKVVWPTRREVTITSIMVFIMAMLTALFFFFVDWMIRIGLQVILTYFN